MYVIPLSKRGNLVHNNTEEQLISSGSEILPEVFIRVAKKCPSDFVPPRPTVENVYMLG